ncbi:MJ0042 family finger-like protein [Solidesulfovibrio fructosivorans JJ]]|uniref:MJ0042 family finger-like protein n=1 Tax=Solidesulfovibrio fructosivorans JJ] TaxID=596151 RepID=E1K0Y7_SOLFR|nr:DUF3426 domain-containing protein [Solidesulfovibrio fructosivorans]EFL49752.1 MJ0042 family finger-like protein [Solidesulfovibrio fructosivorans JJ]]
MIVQCPNCQSKFNLPDDRLGPDGAKLRCGKCRKVFHVDPPTPAAAPSDDLSDFDFPDDMAETPAAAGAAEAAPAAEERVAEAASDDVPPDLFHSESYEAPAEGEEPEEEPDTGPVKPGFSLDDVADIPLPGSAVSKDRRRRIGIIIGAVVLVLAAMFAAIYFLDLMPGKKAGKPEATPPAAEAPATPEKGGKAEKAERPAPEKPAEEAGAKKPEETAKVKDIMLQNVRQYYVSNEKAGQLFVIEGKAVNNFKTPKEMIKLEATLFDEKGDSLASQQELAGNTVSLFQLQVMTRDELKNALTSQVGILTNNTNIAPGGEAPFMVVFFDPPEAVKEFGVKVIDVKDPPRQ